MSAFISRLMNCLSEKLDILCNTMLFVQPKYFDEDYSPLSSQIKKEIESFMDKLEAKPKQSTHSSTDTELVRLLAKLLEILDSSSNLRQNLVRFRNELELFKVNLRSNSNDTKPRMIELAIQVVNVLHYGTFYCFDVKTYDERVETIKLEFEYFKELIRTSPLLVSNVDKFYLGVLYKMPKLMKIKLGYKKTKRDSKINEEIE
jgi:hypothetical protein